jgi:hypothetical protein
MRRPRWCARSSTSTSRRAAGRARRREVRELPEGHRPAGLAHPDGEGRQAVEFRVETKDGKVSLKARRSSSVRTTRRRRSARPAGCAPAGSRDGLAGRPHRAHHPRRARPRARARWACSCPSARRRSSRRPSGCRPS